jgi:hypothetical protein
MGLDVTIQDFLYRILTDSILYRAASADAVFSILSLPRHIRGTRKGPVLPSPRAEKHGLTHPLSPTRIPGEAFSTSLPTTTYL